MLPMTIPLLTAMPHLSALILYSDRGSCSAFDPEVLLNDSFRMVSNTLLSSVTLKSIRIDLRPLHGVIDLEIRTRTPFIVGGGLLQIRTSARFGATNKRRASRKISGS